MDTSRPSDDEITAASRELDGRSPQEVLAWAVRRFHPKLMMATAFGPEGCSILHMLSEIEPAVRVINLDTGYQFAETLELRERIRDGWDRGRTGPAGHHGRRVRARARRPALCPPPGP